MLSKGPRLTEGNDVIAVLPDDPPRMFVCEAVTVPGSIP